MSGEHRTGLSVCHWGRGDAAAVSEQPLNPSGRAVAQAPKKNPRLLLHRDVAELLQCLPDRKFPYKIFDAASGRVLRSLDGENEGFEDESLEVYELQETPSRSQVLEPEAAATPAPVDHGKGEMESRDPAESRGPVPDGTDDVGVPALDSGFRRNDEPTEHPISASTGGLPTDLSRAIDRAAQTKLFQATSAALVENAPVVPESLPRMAEAPARPLVWRAAAQDVPLPSKPSVRGRGVGAVLAMLAGEKRENPTDWGAASARTVLRVLQAPGRGVRRVAARGFSVAQAVHLLQGGGSVTTSLPRVSAGQALRRLGASRDDGLVAVKAAVGAGRHSSSDVVGEARSARKDPPAEPRPRGSAAAILRGVLRH